ncbi:protein lifeguard 1 [Xyrauchen texanus]|uniref:protein lifeguard 1 n=1 Tax=Xyrauchen texanus TaxID=154827 RepID=UPI002242448A|nr:protein lifeguard 1 [Xyrauchen texanus]
MADKQSHNTTQSGPNYGATAPLNSPPSYMPPPCPSSMPAQSGYVAPKIPPEEAGLSKAEEPTGDGYLTETTQLITPSFEDKTIRRAFIRKVFSVVTLQLLVTFSIVCVFTFSNTVKAAVQSNIWVYLSSYIVFLVVAMCLSCCSSFSRAHPWNLVGLSLVTLSLSYMVGTVASYHNTTSVIIALGSTLVISFTIIIFSAQTRVDFTICNGILLTLSVDLLMFGFFCIFFYSTILQVVYGCLGALFYALFLAVDCQLVMGRQKYRLSAEEYVFAALILYLDIIMIFLYILMILGGGSRN